MTSKLDPKLLYAMKKVALAKKFVKIPLGSFAFWLLGRIGREMYSC